MNKEIGFVYETDEYGKFKRLEGNRDVTAQRTAKIQKNIIENGYVFNPIVVNENFAVIDGQGRLEALRNLKLPVHYVIAEGAGVEQCAILNAATTPWKIVDYINSYAEVGNESYKMLKALFEEYHEFSVATRAIVVTGLQGKAGCYAIKAGKVEMNKQMFLISKQDFETIKEFKETVKMARGKTECYYFSILFGLKSGMSRKRLQSAIEKYPMPPAVTMKQALDNISEIYNKNLPVEKRTYLVPLYEESLTKKYGWYSGRINSDTGYGKLWKELK